MAKVHIENYRGIDIYFDTDNETFFGSIQETDFNKQSYASAKKFIDDFIKDNQTFKPFYVYPNPKERYYGDNKKVKVIGIRKDGRFVCERGNGKKEQISEYEEKYLAICNDNTDNILAEMAILQADIDFARKKLKDYTDALTVTTLQDYKKQILK